MDLVDLFHTVRRTDEMMYQCIADMTAGTVAPSADSAQTHWAPVPDHRDYFRQPSTAYAVKDIALCSSLPTGYYLECITAGTTASGAITLPAMIAENASVTDGTVTWKIRKAASTYDMHFRQPSTAYAVGDIAYSPLLASYQRLECVVAGTTAATAPDYASATTGDLIVDGTATFKVMHFRQNYYGDILDTQVNPAAAHNALYRGKDLTAYFDSGDMSAAIADGSFTDIYPGDYIVKTVTVNGVTYEDVKFIVMDLDYFQPWSFGGTETHHLVIMPETALGTQYMNSSNITTGGYVGSYMHTTHIPKVNTGIVAAFGSAHVLAHQEQLTNTVDTSKASGASGNYTGCATNWAATSGLKCCLCSENMVYGGRVWGSAMDTGCAYKQLSAFRHNSQLRKTTSFWLRAVSDSADFALASYAGSAGGGGASASSAFGVRPYFLLS